MHYKLKILISIFGLLLYLNGCNNTSTQPEKLFEATERYSNSFSLPSSINEIIITNPVGVTFLNGSLDSTKISYVIDRAVTANSFDLAQSEMKNIDLEHVPSNDTLYCNINYPDNLNNIYKCNQNLDIPYNKPVAVTIPNQGVYSNFLDTTLLIETTSYQTLITNHSGSAEVHSITGKITVTIDIPPNGFCKCYSNEGDIYVKIPSNSSAMVDLKTISGSITYSGLNLTVDSQSNKEIKGKLGNGESTIYLETEKGNIVLEAF